MNTPKTVPHTPGEWAVEYDRQHDRFQLRSLTQGSFGHFQGWSSDGVTSEDEDKANAAHIVLCVNSHDRLVALAEAAARTACLQQLNGDKCICLSCLATAALAAAQPKP